MSVVVRSEHVAKTITVNGVKYFVDVLREDHSGRYIAVVIDPSGNGQPVFPRSMGGGISLSPSIHELEAPPYVITMSEFFEAPVLSVREVVERAREVVTSFVKMYRNELYDLVTLWICASWLHGVIDKKPNLYVTGMFGTGKSVVAQIVRYLARYPCDVINNVKASELWHAGITKGVIMMDETDVVTKKLAQTLRRMHDSGVRMVRMTAMGGHWEMMSMDISAPICLVGTHLPRDPALLSRGFVVKMHYGLPPRKPVGIREECENIKVVLAKSLVLRWREFLERLYRVYIEVSEEIHARYADIVAPLAAIADMAGIDWGFLELLAKYSSVMASIMNPSVRATLVIARRIAERGLRIGDAVAMDFRDFYALIREVGAELALSRSTIEYVAQYFLSAAEPCVHENREMLCFDRRDLEAIEMLYGFRW